MRGVFKIMKTMEKSPEVSKKNEEIEALVVMVQNGDQDAFSKLYDHFIDQIYRYVFFRVNSDDAEDIIEMVFVKAWEHINKYTSGKSTFSAWLFRIAHNLVVDYYRMSKDRDFHELDLNIVDHNREHNPIKVTEQALDNVILKKALASLKKQYQDILVYKFINDLSNQEISTILGKTDGSLRILQHRALKALKAQLEEMGIKYHF